MTDVDFLYNINGIHEYIRSLPNGSKNKINKKYEGRDKFIFSPKTENQKGTRPYRLFHKYIYTYIYINPQTHYGDRVVTKY